VNFLKILVIVAFSVFLHDFAHDMLAKKYGFISEYRIWGIKRFGFGREVFPKKINLFGKEITVQAFPIGAVLCVLVTLFSNGRLFFTAVSSYGLVIKKAHRLGKRFIEVTDFEEAKIALAGPMANILLAIIFKIFNSSGIFDDVIFINSVMPIFDMLPFPGLDGAKVFWGSRPLYVFSFLFILAAAISLRFLSAIPALLLALAVAVLFLIAYIYRALTR